MSVCLRIAFVGDSWIMDWAEEAESGQWALASPIADAAARVLSSHLEKHGGLEVTVSGFPGGTAENTLRLAEHCSIKEMSTISTSGTSLKKAVAHLQEGCEKRPAQVDEAVDFVVIALGPNDLNHQHDAIEVSKNLLRLRRIFAQRGVEAAFVSVGGAGPGEEDAWPDYEANRLITNSHLKQQAVDALIVDCDMLVADLPEETWVEGWHLTLSGYSTVGQRLGEALAPRCLELAQGFPKQLPERVEELPTVAGDATVKWEGYSWWHHSPWHSTYSHDNRGDWWTDVASSWWQTES